MQFVSVYFALSAQRRRLAMLGAAIATITSQVHLAFSDGTAVRLPGTYGRVFAPVQNLLWAHTSPGLALIMAGPSLLYDSRTHKSIVLIMLSGFFATARVPPSIPVPDMAWGYEEDDGGVLTLQQPEKLPAGSGRGPGAYDPTTAFTLPASPRYGFGSASGRGKPKRGAGRKAPRDGWEDAAPAVAVSEESQPPGKAAEEGEADLTGGG